MGAKEQKSFNAKNANPRRKVTASTRRPRRTPRHPSKTKAP